MAGSRNAQKGGQPGAFRLRIWQGGWWDYW